MRIAICDDDPAELRRVKSTAERFFGSKQLEYEIVLDAFADGEGLLCGIKKRGGYDLVILDILMPGPNGIELAQKMREEGDDCKIIFLTSSPEFAVASYRVNAFYYLLKPFSEEELATLIGKAMQAAEDERGSSIVIKTKGRLTRLRLGAIRYIESVNHNVHFHLRGGDVLVCFSSLNEFHDALLADRRFVRCHKSFLVNMDYVTGISGKEFALDAGAQVPISRNVYQQVKSAYFDYFFEGGTRRSL